MSKNKFIVNKRFCYIPLLILFNLSCNVNQHGISKEIEKEGFSCGRIDEKEGFIEIFTQIDSMSFIRITIKNELTLMRTGTFQFIRDESLNSENKFLNLDYLDLVIDTTTKLPKDFPMIDGTPSVQELLRLKIWTVFPCNNGIYPGYIEVDTCQKCKVEINVKGIQNDEREYELRFTDSCIFKKHAFSKFNVKPIHFRNNR